MVKAHRIKKGRSMMMTVWHTKLFECDQIPNYCINLVCPWAVIYNLLERLSDTADPHHPNNNNHYQHSSSSQCCSFISCCMMRKNWPSCLESMQSLCTSILPCFLVANEITRQIPSTNPQRVQGYYDGEEDEDDNNNAGYHQGLPDLLNNVLSPFGLYSAQDIPKHVDENKLPEASSVFPLLFMMGQPQHHSDESTTTTTAQGIGQTMQAITFLTVCMGTICIVPTTCWLRHTVDKKYHVIVEESMWANGLVSCCAWPCALNQLRCEMDYYDEHHHHPHYHHATVDSNKNIQQSHDDAISSDDDDEDDME